MNVSLEIVELCVMDVFRRMAMHKTSSMGSSFLGSGVAKWNSLPIGVRDPPTIWSFKRRIEEQDCT